MVLEDLDTGEFESLGGTYGSARDIPGLLRALSEAQNGSDQAELVSRLAIEVLREDTWLAEATAHALPYMLELMNGRSLALRSEVLALGLTNVQVAEQTLALAASPEAHVLEQQRFATDVREALRAEHARLLSLLSDAEPRVRAHAALLLAYAARETLLASACVDSLTLFLSREQEMLPRVAGVAALELARGYEHARPYLDDVSFAVRVAAALCVVHCDDPGALCFDVLASALQDVERTRAQYGEAACFRPLTLTRTICCAGKTKAVTLFSGLMHALLSSSPYQAEEALEPLLAAFVDGGIHGAPTREQAALLATVVRHPAYFRRVATPVALLVKYGLPLEREELARLAARGPSDAEALVPEVPRVP
jgi:hypothetical protein